MFSIQRLIDVFFPLKRQLFCNKRTTRSIIICLFIFGAIFYSYTLVTSSLEIDINNRTLECVTVRKWHDLADFLSFIDTIQTIIIPFVLISFINISVLFKLVKKFKTSWNKTKKWNNSIIKNINPSTKKLWFILSR